MKASKRRSINQQSQYRSNYGNADEFVAAADHLARLGSLLPAGG